MPWYGKKRRYAQKTAMERWSALVSPDPNTGCWFWVGAFGKHGYGQFSIKADGGKWTITTAHRASWVLHNGEIPNPRLQVCHSCDNQACVNPEHLWLGTAQMNSHDMWDKGRAGSQNGKTNKGFPRVRKLTPERVRAIRASMLPLRDAADLYGVSMSAISKIRNRKAKTLVPD